MEGMNASDVALLTKDTDGFGNSWLGMIIVLFFLVYGMNGTWGGNNRFDNAIGYENLATSNEVQRGFDNQNSMANQREILAAVNAGTAQSVATSNQVFHDMLGVFSDKYSELQRDISNVALAQMQAMSNQNECCCNTLRAIDGVNYNGAMNTNQIVQAIQAEGNATRSMMQQNRFDDLQQKYDNLNQRLNTQQLQDSIREATSNVVRYPNGFVYNAGPSPFCGCGNSFSNCCGNI